MIEDKAILAKFTKLIKKEGWCLIRRSQLNLETARIFAAVNSLRFSIERINDGDGSEDYYLFQTNEQLVRWNLVERREQHRIGGQYILFTILATIFFLLIWLL